ncbi:syntaxin-12-like [Sycon ciliatum]|uniref:syntaxin-12-like n=1 Tax=Sycon ciliatum TaxID=27933 RepID=UPI0020AD522B|eukprot:scpid62922/ scgid32775/ Syntaxin-12
MSRGEFGSAARGEVSYGTLESTGRSSGSAGVSWQDDTSQFDKVGSNTQMISSNVSSLEKLLKQIGTPSDGEPLRNRLHTLSHNTQVLASDTNVALKNLGVSTQGANKRQQRIQLERLRKDFRASLTRYQKVQEAIQENVSLRAPPGGRERNPFQEDDDDQEALLAADEEEHRRAVHQQTMQAEFETEQYEERATQVQQIERDILEINEIFRDLGALVQEQGTLVDNIEEHIETGHHQVEEGNRQLSKAALYQKKARKKMCCLVIVLLVVAVALFCVIYFPIRAKKNN